VNKVSSHAGMIGVSGC